MIHVRSGWPLKAFCGRLAIVLKLHKGVTQSSQEAYQQFTLSDLTSQVHVTQGEAEVRLLCCASQQQGKLINFPKVDLPVAYWKALCGHWNQSYKEEY